MADKKRDNSQLDSVVLLQRAYARLLTYGKDVAVLALVTAALVTLLGLTGLTKGSLVDAWVTFLRRWIGLGAFPSPLIPLGVALWLVASSKKSIPWLTLILMEVLFFLVLAMLSSLDAASLTNAEQGQAGGLVGWAIATALGDLVGEVGRIVILLFSAIATFIFMLRTLPLAAAIPQFQAPTAPPFLEEPSSGEKRPRTRVPKEFQKDFQVQKPVEMTTESAQSQLPLTILERGRGGHVTSREINHAAGLIEKTLDEFGLPVKVVDFRTGPTITQFAVEPGYTEQDSPEGKKLQKVKVSQISGLAKDLALSLSAASIRIEAPVPGKSFVGIEVPNKKPELVRLRPILESQAFTDKRADLPIALGRDVAGAPVVDDLAMMPHLLIAGTTGSGKSICIATIATCLAMHHSPQQLRMVMIDPKMVELIRFNGLPHLIGKVESDLPRISGVLRWCTVEMDRRYRLLEEMKARDLTAYNARVAKRDGVDPLPRLAVMIDELADLMMMAPDQTEGTLVRLAQMARATGIHLVVATQRPSTDILTGLIKANFPARISFAVASAVDSRVILDSTGAETLLGKGDMLYLSPEAGAPIRLQGIFVDDKEVESLIQGWRKKRITADDETPWDELLEQQRELAERDDMLEQAIELVRKSGQASASMLQRRLRIGYPRAASLMDQLEELGIVGRAQSGGRTREVLIGEEEDDDS
jgi:S-DNA-T family DNA segregation ATPase FtsK/SpoIIIE